MRLTLDSEKKQVSTSSTDANHLSGYTLRPMRFDDLEEYVKLTSAYAMAVNGKVEESPEEITKIWETPKFNLETDTMAVFAEDGSMHGAAELWDISESHVRLWSWICVHPEHHDKGLGDVLLEWLENRARENVKLAPEGAKVVLLNDSDARDAHRIELFRQRGYEAIRRFWRMVIALDEQPPPAAFPEDVHIVTMAEYGTDDSDFRRLYKAVKASFQDHWGYVEEPFEMSYANWSHWMHQDKKFDASVWFLAMVGDEIVGFSLCKNEITEDPDMGWVDTLGVIREHRRNGIALGLLHHSFNVFKKRDKKHVGLGVDASSLTNATGLYERAGMHSAREYRAYELLLRDGKDISTQSVETED